MAERQVLKLAKFTALLAICVTTLSLSAILTWQTVDWVTHGDWSSIPISQALEVAGIYVQRRYIIADTTGEPIPGDLLEWSLNLPALLPLIMALPLLVVFYGRLSAFERQLGLTKVRTAG